MKTTLSQTSGSSVPLRRERKRIDSVIIDKAVIAERIKMFYDTDHQDRSAEIDARLQRYAKFRMWTSGHDYQMQEGTDCGLPDMMTASMRLQDTLHNAVMSARPPIMAKANKPTDKDKEETINHLLDFQFFEEQPGESMVGQLADDFVNEGFFTAYTPWIEETRRAREIKLYDPVPTQMVPVQYFYGLLQGFFPKGEIIPSGDGWDFKIKDGDKRAKASFFTNEDGVELELEREVEVFNGPRAIRKDLQDILHPARCENLQIPGPSNPSGASHVIMRDFPSVDELKRLQKSGYYDLMTDEDAKKLGIKNMETQYQQREEQKDIMQGHAEQKPEPPKGAESHKPLTRLMCFDCFDIDGDGLDEDVVFWMILEEKIILKAVYLSQVFPSSPPRRPFAEAQLFPVPGRRLAIGLLEMMESTHDVVKTLVDLGLDSGILANWPFFFYRASSNMRPEVVRMSFGEGYPLSDPKNDVYFPSMGNQNQSFMFNAVSMFTAVQERLSNIGDLQLGRVPAGKASALRTVAGMQTVLSQGDARPERVLRRFFMGLAQIFQNFHALNEVKLPPKKRFMLCGPIDPRKDPYAIVESPNAIRGNFRFTFSANALNTSKEALQSALHDLMAAYINPMAIQMGIMKPDGAYRMLRDYGRAKGQDPDKYLSPPTPGAQEPPISAEDAILYIMDGILPNGSPMEGTAEHFQKLQTFMQSDEFGYLGPEHIPLFRAYLEQVAQRSAQEQAQAVMLKAAAQFQGGGGQAMPGPPAAPQGPQAAAPLQGNELADESLPGAGGGANHMGMQ